MNKNVFLLLLGTALVPAGCNLAPQYDRPNAPVPAEWPSGAAYQDTRTAANAPQAPDLSWQEFFSDEKLQKLIETAWSNNRDLRLAALNVERARALYGIQRAELLPTADAVAGGSKQRLPADLSPTGQRATVEQYSVNLGVFSWELDFFGRIRNLNARALEQYLATEQARRSAQILLVSSVANAYLVLAADREGLALAQTTLANQQDAYNLIKRSYDLGLAPELDLFRAQTQVDAARGDVARFTQLAAQDENALSLLLGAAAPGELLPARLDDVAPPEEISPGVSSEVLLRRPDVLQAESLLRAAHADIGAARATLFPRISLTGTVGTASSELSGLFGSGSGTWSFAPQAAMPIFDTRAWLALGVTRVQREIALTQYEGAIQNAFREVADALAVRGTVDQQVSAQESLVHAVAETYRLSTTRYDKGIDSYLSVLDAQRSLYAAQQGLVFLRLAKLANQVRLYAVLGGGSDPAPDRAEPRS
ncbi:MAG: multidrug transporter [Planctomycetes bacterium RBG_13_60_9]|nr:MAG: multidrug transporter [Planctomycetes bacterium RBG_13_60_9]